MFDGAVEFLGLCVAVKLVSPLDSWWLVLFCGGESVIEPMLNTFRLLITDHPSAPSTSKTPPTGSAKLIVPETGSSTGQKAAGQLAKADIMLSCLNCKRPVS